MKPIISQNVLFSAVERDFGIISTTYRVSEGEESLAIGIRVAEEDLILRANRCASGFHKDDYCYHMFASTTLPIPQILLISSVCGISYCISRRAAGVTLQDLRPSELPAVTSMVAQAMQAIAEAPLANAIGFGKFDANGVGEHNSWRNFLEAIADPNQYDWSRVGDLVSSRWVDRYLHKLVSLLTHCPERKQLVHADFGSNNVITDRSSITGVIDWSDAMFGDPLYDVANIFFWRPWLSCMDELAGFFERHKPHLISDITRLSCYQLRIGLAQVYDCAMNKQISDLRWAMKRCEEVSLMSGP